MVVTAKDDDRNPLVHLPDRLDDDPPFRIGLDVDRHVPDCPRARAFSWGQLGVLGAGQAYRPKGRDARTKEEEIGRGRDGFLEPRFADHRRRWLNDHPLRMSCVASNDVYFEVVS